MESALGARVLITKRLTISLFFFPARLAARRHLGAVHTARATVLLPAKIKLQIILYRWQVKLFRHQPFNESQSFEVILGIKALAASSKRLDYTVSFPDTNCFGMHT